MAAALPHIDDFLPVHDLRSLQELAAQLARIPRRKGAVDVGRSGARSVPRSSVPAPSGLAVVHPREVGSDHRGET
jgi:hypothetical protein